MEPVPLRCRSWRSPTVGFLLLALTAVLVMASCATLSDAADLSPCDRDRIGEDDGQLVGAYTVVEGELDELCFGSADPRLAESWKVLEEFATPAELSTVAVFAGYRTAGAATGNVAFAGPLGESNRTFVVAVDLVEASRDHNELRVTMAHEFAHVISQDASQVDLAARRSSCDTYWNGSWCFVPDSYMADWVAEFWPAETLHSLPTDGTSDSVGGDDRCNIDPSFLGSYAASHPEEDFAESFAAFVYSIEVPDEVQTRQSFFTRYPELVAYRDRASAAGASDLPNNFDRCG